jgi:hypothetical protein
MGTTIILFHHMHEVSAEEAVPRPITDQREDNIILRSKALTAMKSSGSPKGTGATNPYA